MKKTLCLLGISLCLPLISEAWGSRYSLPPPEQATNLNMNFPYNIDQEWFTDEGYLLWKTFQGDMAYTFFDSQPSTDPQIGKHKGKVKNPDYGWDSGVRIGIGKYLPHHDLWDINLYTTYFYADADNKRKVNGPVEGVTDVWTFGFVFGPSQQASLSSHINYFTWDLSVRRAYTMLPTVVVYPYVGLRAALIYQEYRVKYVAFENSISGFVDANLKNKLNNDFWGLGPRIGSNFVWHFRKHWSFLGNFAGSFIWGHQTIKENIVENFPTVQPQFTTVNHVKYEDTDSPLRMNIEGAVGLGWERWVRRHTVRIAPSFMFEGTLWLSMNQVPQFADDGGLIFLPGGKLVELNKSTRHHGNLGFMGVSFNLQIDF